MEKVLEGAGVVLVTTPAQYHPAVAKAMAPFLVDGQLVVLNPGRTLGTYVFDKTLRENGLKGRIILAETETFLFTCRCITPGYPILYAIKHDVKLAAHDPANTPQAVSAWDSCSPPSCPPAACSKPGWPTSA